ncbi:hypothetical protein [Sphingobium sp. TomTYG45]
MKAAIGAYNAGGKVLLDHPDTEGVVEPRGEGIIEPTPKEIRHFLTLLRLIV